MLEKTKKELYKIHPRKMDKTDIRKVLNTGKICFYAALLLCAILALCRVYIFMVIGVVAYFVWRFYLMTFYRDEVRIELFDYQMDATFVMALRETDEFGSAVGEELYYLYNELIMHENMVRIEGGHDYHYGGDKPDKMEGPVVENRKKVMTMIRDSEFQNALCAEILRGREEYQGWKITPIERVYTIRPGILASHVVIAGRRGQREKIHIAWDLEDRKELMQKLRELTSKKAE